MKRLELSRVLIKRDTRHRGALQELMRQRLKAEAKKRGMKPGPVTFDEHYEEIEGGAFTLLVIDARMDIR